MSNADHMLKILRDRACRKQRGLCYWCGQPMDGGVDPRHPRRLTADHHPKPRHAGGKTVPGNIVAACRKCNNERHPEFNRSKKSAPQVHTAGDDTPRSPFEKLKERTYGSAHSKTVNRQGAA